jgi:hypothetical protein
MTILSTTQQPVATSSLTDRCPWCSTLIPRTKFLEIQSKIRDEEKRKLAEAEATMQRRLQAQEATIRKTAQEETERKFKLLLEQNEETRKRELNDTRQVLQKDRDQALLKERAGFNREREAFQKKIKEMERQLERKTANQIGDGAEIDLLEVLREAFLDDRITRVKKGEPGADIIHEVLYKGEVCGRIVTDSKNRQGWQSSYVSKLRQDQLDAKADYAIISTTVFPTGKKELCIEDGVIVANPARISHIVQLLRKTMIEMHVRGLTMKEREDKKSHLYNFITSATYAQHFREAQKLTRDILDLEVEEQRQHSNVWKKRGPLAKKMEHVLREMDTEITGILEGTEQV